VSDLRSAPLPPVGPDDHVRGPEGAPLVVVYGDYECPFCAALEVRLRELPYRVAFRHFPVRGSHPRAQAAAHAAEAAAAQDAFWAMHDALFDDQGRLEDPHLWARAERLGLDVERFERARRSAAVAERVRKQFRAGVRAGIVTTPTLLRAGRRYSGRTAIELLTYTP
jgi:protein-disulfide isomerase